MLSCSIIIPVHNEGQNIEKFVTRFINDLKDEQKRNIEIFLIENGSTDDSYKACSRLVDQFRPMMRLEQIGFSSYGEAIKRGIILATGEVTCILECDLLDVGFLVSALNILQKKEADFVVASKRHSESIDLRPFKRRFLTFLFNTLLKIFFDFPGTDTHGLKALRTDLAKALCSIAITKDEIFQSELVLLAYKIGYRVKEVPIRLEEKRYTSISIYRRLHKLIGIIRDLKKSLNRF